MDSLELAEHRASNPGWQPVVQLAVLGFQRIGGPTQLLRILKLFQREAFSRAIKSQTIILRYSCEERALQK